MPLKIEIIGLGFMGKIHFDTYARIPGARVAAGFDRRNGLCQRRGAAAGPAFGRY